MVRLFLCFALVLLSRFVEAQNSTPVFTTYGSYNTSFGSLNIAECSNLSNQRQDLTLTLVRFTGELVTRIPFSLQPYAVRHIILNDLQDSSNRGIADEYGSYEVSSTGVRDSIYCHTMTYRYGTDGELEYVFSTAEKELSGLRYGNFNTYNPDNHAGLTLNWLTIKNLENTATKFKVEQYFEGHQIFYDLELRPKSRIDLPLGEGRGRTTGFYLIRPLTNWQAYSAYNTRYAPNQNGFAFAFQQQPTPALNFQRLAVSTTANALNWLTFSNPYAVPVKFRITLRNQVGEQVYSEPISREIGPRETQHLLTNPLIDPSGQGVIGTAEIITENPSHELVAESVFYGFDPDTSARAPKLLWAYSSQGVRSPAGGKVTRDRFALVNTYLSAANWLKFAGVPTGPNGRINKTIEFLDNLGNRFYSSQVSLRLNSKLDLATHDRFGQDVIGVVRISSYENSQPTPDQLIRVYYRRDGKIGAIAPVDLPQGAQAEEASLLTENQFPSDSLFQVPFIVFNAARQELTVGGSSAGQIQIDQNPRKLSITAAPKIENQIVKIRLPLPVSQGSFWTFSSVVKLNASSEGSVSVKVSAYERDANDQTISSQILGTTELNLEEEKFLNYAIQSSNRLTTKVLLFLEISHQSETPASFRLDFLDPALVRKQDLLLPGVVLNYIDAETVIEQNRHHRNQLRELFGVGHQLWVIGHREVNPYGFSSVELAKRTAHAIRNSPELSSSKYILADLQLHSRKYCDIVHYLDRGTDTFQYPPVYRITHSGVVGTKPSADTIEIRENCVELGDHRDPRHENLIAEFDELALELKEYGSLAGGIYLVDESASVGLPVSYLEQIYSYLTKRFPSLPLYLTHSYYIGGPILSREFSRDVVEKFYSPSVADVFLFDHYSLPALRDGDSTRQAEFLGFLESYGMLSKTFIKLLGTTVNATVPCNVGQNIYQNGFDLTVSTRQDLLPTSRTNWKSIGFWAFYNKEARSVEVSRGTSWDGTLAWQQQGYCSPQYLAVLEFSASHNQLD